MESRGRQFTDGSPVTERGIRRALNLTILAAAFSNVWQSIIVGVPYQMYLAVLNASGAVVGLAGTLSNFTMVLQLPGAFLSEALKERRPLVVVFATVQRALWFVPAFMPLFSKDPGVLALVLVGVVIFSAALGNFITGSWLAWMTDLIPNERAGSYWGRRICIVMPIYLGTTFLAGYALDFLPVAVKSVPLIGFMAVFFVAGVFSMLDMYWQWRTPEVEPERPNRESGMLERTVAPLRNRDFRFLTMGFAIWYLMTAVFGAFSFIYLRQVHGISYHVIALVAAASTLGTVVFSRISGYIIDRLSARNYMIFLLIVEPLLTIYWFFLYPDRVLEFGLPGTGLHFAVREVVLVLVVGQFLFGALTNGVWMIQMALIGVHAPRNDRSIAIAVHNCVVGLLSCCGPLAAGFAVDWLKDFRLVVLGSEWHYMQLLVIFLALVIWGGCLPLICRLRKMEDELQFREAASRLLFYNPFRVVRSMYHIFTIQNSTDAESRAEAIEELGEENAAIAVKDLVEKMYDASYEVREAAAKALGAIGSPDAVKAILKLLEDEDIDLPITLIRALRQNESSEGVPLLIEKLDAPNPFVQREAARTLGVLGGTAAVPRLWELLRTTRNASVATATAGALAKLGCRDAVKDVWAQYQETANPTLRKEMALAMGEMLVPGGDFYEVMTKEEKNFASQPEKLVRTFSWSVVCLAERLSSSQTPGRTGHQNVLLATGQKEKARQILAAYEGNPALAALLCWNIGRDLAMMRFNLEEPRTRDPRLEEGFLDNLYDCDAGFGLGMWYLRELNEAARRGGHVGSLEILLACFFLSCWCRAEAVKP